MKLKYLIIFLLIILASCHRHQPQGTKSEAVKNEAPKKLPANFKMPKTLSASDQAATKTPDGRLYIDVEGHRYWKNFKDGKYYLFNKAMYGNPDFKPR